MGCATAHIAKLRGERPFLSGPAALCKVRGAEYLHLITAIDGDRFQIGNDRGHINGRIGKTAIFGRLLRVEP